MTLDVFRLREDVVSEYRDYVRSFIRIRDRRVDTYVRNTLEAGELWPEAVLQLNPAFAQDATLGELAGSGQLMEETARFFGKNTRLYRHQREALEIGLRGQSYIVTTGTGSGKSLTYLIPIFDAVVRNNPSDHSVRAILVYPMNALINSQLDALEAFRNNFPDSPVRFERYTGQEGNEDRNRILEDPPHILLTNYVMAEYLLVRPAERPLLHTATRSLQTLVMDELHFYRGRQGADVAMLTRRLQERAGQNLQAVATSATMATGDSRQERKQTVAQLASRFFGQEIPSAHVVDETLQRVAQVPVPASSTEVRSAIETPPPASHADAVRQHPLVAWVEDAFGLVTEEERLVRRRPKTFVSAVQNLSQTSGLSSELCQARLRSALDAGNAARDTHGQPVLAFRLHQWLSSGSNVYATLEDPGTRVFSMQGQVKLDSERLLFPLAFCRECGQEYYLVARQEDANNAQLLPRYPTVGAPDEIEGQQPGFFALESDDLWRDNVSDLPDTWLTASGRSVKKDYATYRPRRYRVGVDGSLGESPRHACGWFQPAPFLLCLRCRAVHVRRSNSDYRKLSLLSQTGRSTATTIGADAAVAGMMAQQLAREEAKVLSFTDNRQDASLQAGHLNDFVQVALLRAGLFKAMRQKGSLTFSELGTAIFEALNLSSHQFLREAVDEGPGARQGRKALIDLLEHLALEDLARDWRITQPDLEMTGLLRIQYIGLEELAAQEELWSGLPAMGEVAAAVRQAVLCALLDHLRRNLAIDAHRLTESAARQLVRDTGQWLADPWCLEENDRLRTQGLAFLPGIQPTRAEQYIHNTFKLGSRSAVGRYLRSPRTWNISERLTDEACDQLIHGILNALKGHILSVHRDEHGQDRGVRVLAGALRWTRGDGNVPRPDPVRTSSLHLRKEMETPQKGNSYFSRLYQDRDHLRGMQAAEHTGQISPENRIEREGKFRDGNLPVLFCSPTMELGVDIRDLHMVHLRNVPPTPANYAQRSGRAGRSGQPALIVAFAAQGNAHDQYFFGRRNDMIAGAVAPARMDLQNEPLVLAHLHSTWLACTSLTLGRSVADVLDLGVPDFPLRSEIAAQLADQNEDRIYEKALDRCRYIVSRTRTPAGDPVFGLARVEEILRRAPQSFNAAFDPWRELYRSTATFRDAARRRMDDPYATAKVRDDADRQLRAAQREIQQLLNQTGSQEESDFYPYRYLATAGFLPGYNFPRLPVRTSVAAGNKAQIIDRPRFIGLTEFGPGNRIYHEGRKHYIESLMPPPSGIDESFQRALLCNVCGYLHEQEHIAVEVCRFCSSPLDATHADHPQRLLDQPMMRSRPVERISSEEEERARRGYVTTTHFSLDGNTGARFELQDPHDQTLMEAFFAPTARLWKINHGWRGGQREGFSVDPATGRWERKSDIVPQDPGERKTVTGVRPYVQDMRNLLMLRPVNDKPSRPFLLSLLYALKRAIQFIYHLEEQEIEAELIGQGEHLRLLYWEAAEGGTGVWHRIASEPDALAEIAKQALSLCHFDPATGQDDPSLNVEPCAAACYRCLLAYGNQREHRLLDRMLLPEYLVRLADSSLVPTAVQEKREDRFRRLLALADSTLEEDFLHFLHDKDLALPDEAQNRPTSHIYVQPDFYYRHAQNPQLPGICIFIDGPVHDTPENRDRDERLRTELRNRGFGVIAIRYDRPFADQVKGRPDIFGQLD